MARKKGKYHVNNGIGYDQIWVETILSQVMDSPIKSLERSTAYKANAVCSEATLPKGGFLVCTTAGTSASTVPTAFSSAAEGAVITDGTAKFTVHYFDQLVSLAQAVRSVNSIKPDSNGNVSITTVTNATNATNASKLTTNAGSATNPVYFANGVPVKTTYTLNKSVPSDAKFTDTTYAVMSAATASAAGKSGLTPVPAAGAQNKFLRGDGTWQDVDIERAKTKMVIY